MFDVGFLEMVLVFVLALVVLGPERLPRVARTLGLWVGRARAVFYAAKNQLDHELRVEEMRRAGYEIEDQVRAVIKPPEEPPPQEPATADKPPEEQR